MNDAESEPTRSRVVSASRDIAAPPEAIFALLADPSKHALFDGSGSVKGARGPASQELALGSTFSMSMRIGVPYRIKNTVVEFEQDRLIAWRHAGGHRWRYELEPIESGTRVTESFDWSTSRSPWVIEKMGYPAKNLKSIEATLERLEQVVTAA